MLISNLTDNVFRPTISNTSRSTSPVGNGCCWGGAAPPPPTKSRGIGGRFLLRAGEFERRGESSGCSVSSGCIVGAFEDTLKNEDEPLLCVALSVVAGPAPPDCRPVTSLSFSFSLLLNVGLVLVLVPFTLGGGCSLSLLLRMPKESFDALRTIRFVVPPESPDPPEPCLRCLRGDGVGVASGSCCREEMSIEGRCIQSKPVLVSLYCTCMRSSTRRISVFSVAGVFVDVVATLFKKKTRTLNTSCKI